MKKIISVITSSIFAASCIFSSAYADMQILNESKVLKISEKYDSAQKLTLTVATASNTSINSTSLPLMMYLYNTDSTGNFETDLTLSSKWKSGKYTLYIDSETDSRSQNFIYVNTNDTATFNAVLSVNQAESGSGIKQILAETDSMGDKASKLGIDSTSDDYIAYSDRICEYIFETKTVDYSVDAFIKAYAKGLETIKLVDSIKTADSNKLKTIIEENAAFFGIDLAGDYALIVSKNQIYDKMLEGKGELKYADSVKKCFEDALDYAIVSSVKNEKDPSALKEVIEKGNNLYNIDLTGDYSKLCVKEQVFEKIIVESEKITDSASVKKAFEDAVAFVIVNSVKNANSYGEIREILEKSGSLYNVDLTDSSDDYYSITDKYKVFVEMYENRASITDAASVKTCFRNAVNAVLNASSPVVEKPVSGSSSGGGGGGGKISLPSTSAPSAPQGGASGSNAGQPSLSDDFTDISGHFSHNAVKTLTSSGILSGYPDGTFKPDNQVTRAEFAKIAATAFGIQPSQGALFDDVAESDWFAGYVNALSSNGVLNGYDGKFNPYSPITRQDAACVIYRLMTEKLKNSDASEFGDSSDISEYAKVAVNALRANAIVNGNGNMFYPLSNITRGEAAMMFMNAINANK